MAQPLSRLTYRSRSTLSGSAVQRRVDVVALVAQSRINNSRTGLTGVVLFDGELFLQVLEGEPAAVERAYERIACDSRHEELEIINVCEAQGREYGAWSMALLQGEAMGDAALRRFLCGRREWLRDGLECALPGAVRDAMLLAVAGAQPPPALVAA